MPCTITIQLRSPPNLVFEAPLVGDAILSPSLPMRHATARSLEETGGLSYAIQQRENLEPNASA